MADKFERPPIDIIGTFPGVSGQWFLVLWQYLQDLQMSNFQSENAWKIFYTDGNGTMQELGLGAEGEVLTAHGSAAPTWE